MTVPLSTIARVVALAVLKLVFAGGIGAISFRQLLKDGKATKAVLKDVSQINKDVLLPCFILAQVAIGTSAEMVVHLWIIPIFVAASVAFGFVAGKAAAFLTRAPASQWPVAVTVVTFSNVVGLPLPLIDTLIDGIPQWASQSGIHSRGTSFLFLANCVQSILMWSCAAPMLAGRFECGKGPGASKKEERRQSTLSMLSSNSPRSDQDVPSTTPSTAELELEAPPESIQNGEAEAAAPAPEPPQTMSRRARRRLRRTASSLNQILNRPIKASLFGLLIGCTPLRPLMSDDDAPLRWILDGMNLIGLAAVPLVVFVLGATMSNGPQGGAMPYRTMAGVVFAKLLIVPMMVLGLLLLCVRTNLVPRGDGLLPFTMLIIGSSPTAMNINLIATLQGTGQKEVASLMFYEYLLAILSVSLVASVGLVLFL